MIVKLIEHKNRYCSDNLLEDCLLVVESCCYNVQYLGQASRISNVFHVCRAVARTLMGGGVVFIHIFMFCPTSFFSN